MTEMFGKSFLKLVDLETNEILYLLELAKKLKLDKKNGVEKQLLKNKNICLIFEKDSTRTRCAFEVACYDLGGRCTYLSSTSQMGKKETVKDTARVLGRIYDGIEFRGFHQKDVEMLASFANVPVFNGLTDDWHPTQILATFLTFLEHSDYKKRLNEIKFAFLGYSQFNMGRSLMVGAAKMGMDIRLVGPKSLLPPKNVVIQALEISKSTGAKILLTEDIEKGVKDVDFVYTDTWVAMGEPEEVWEERIRLLKKYQVSTEIMKLTGNKDVKFTHCLPSFHNDQIVIGKKIKDLYGLDSMEVTDEVFESKMSIVFDEAENRLHTIKAVLVASLCKEKLV